MNGNLFSLYRRKESGTYYARFRLPNGKWGNPRSTRTYKKTDAILWCQEYLRTIGQPTQKTRITFEDFTSGFYDIGGIWERSIEAHHGKVSGTHLKNQQGRLKNYLLPVFGSWKLDEISSGDVDRAILHIRNNAKPKRNTHSKQLSSSTVNHLRSCLGAIFSEAVRQGYMSRNPMQDVPRLRDQPKSRGILTVEELQKLIDPETAPAIWKSPRYYLIFQIALSTAARSGEIRSLHPEDIKDDHIIFRRSIDDIDGEKGCTKNGDHRTAPLTPGIHKSLMAWIKNHNIQDGSYIFESPVKTGNPIDRESILKNFRATLSRIGIERDIQIERGIVFHSLRHAAASLAVAEGVNPWLVKQMTGHKSEAVFQKYVDHSDAADWTALQNWQQKLMVV